MISKKLSIFLKTGGVLSKEDSSKLFHEIYHTKSHKIKKQVFYIVGDSLYEDVLQEVFFKIHKNLSKFNQKSSLDTWIYKIALNTSLDCLKKESKKSNFKNANTSEDLFPQKDYSKRELIEKAILKLSDKHKKVFILFYITEESVKDISQILNIPEGTVKSRLNKSREEVKSFLKENGVNYE